MASSAISGERVLEAVDQRISTITTRTAEMEQNAKEFGSWRYCFDPGRKNSTLFLATGTCPRSTHQPKGWPGTFCESEDNLNGARATSGQDHLPGI